MAHGNARLNVHGRRLVVQRVREEGWAVAHVAKAMGISRQCAHRWLARWDAEGDAGLVDRSSRPHTSPNQTPPEVEERVLDARRRLRQGPDLLAPVVGVPAAPPLQLALPGLEAGDQDFREPTLTSPS